MKKLWLDDVRPAPDGWYWAKTVEEAKTFMRENRVSHISLDHDLGDNVPTGYDFACWLEERVYNDDMKQPYIMKVHSDNGPGRKNINAAFGSIKRFSQERFDRRVAEDRKKLGFG